MVRKVMTGVCAGIRGMLVTVETDICNGLPNTNIVGLAATTIMEARERVRASIINSGFTYPMKRITINLTPGALRKAGTHFDLPIAIGILAAEGIIRYGRKESEETGFIGELTLDGGILPVSGVLPMTVCLRDSGIKRVIVPEDNLKEASLVSGIEIYGVRSLTQCIELMAQGFRDVRGIEKTGEGSSSVGNGEIMESPDGTYSSASFESSRGNDSSASSGSSKGNDSPASLESFKGTKSPGSPEGSASSGSSECPGSLERSESLHYIYDYIDVKGQEYAKRAITIAAAGEHGLIMVGNPGCGKSMLAKRLPSILPPMREEEIIESTIIYSVSGQIDNRRGVVDTRPFRMPHYSISKAALIGGGLYPVPGEITLAHNGVLFLDEITEFDRDVIENLRTPMESGQIIHSRQGVNYTFPCNFMLIMAANQCKCGYYGDPEHVCTCTPGDIMRYRSKLSGPIMERIDMQIVMKKVTYEEISRDEGPAISSRMMKEDVDRAIAFRKSCGRMLPNSRLTDDEVVNSLNLGDDEEAFLNMAYKKFNLSPRTYMKVLRVARTIADMEESLEVTVAHLSEAISYRNAVEKIHE